MSRNENDRAENSPSLDTHLDQLMDCINDSSQDMFPSSHSPQSLGNGDSVISSINPQDECNSALVTKLNNHDNLELISHARVSQQERKKSSPASNNNIICSINSNSSVNLHVNSKLSEQKCFAFFKVRKKLYRDRCDSDVSDLIPGSRTCNKMGPNVQVRQENLKSFLTSDVCLPSSWPRTSREAQSINKYCIEVEELKVPWTDRKSEIESFSVSAQGITPSSRTVTDKPTDMATTSKSIISTANPKAAEPIKPSKQNTDFGVLEQLLPWPLTEPTVCQDLIAEPQPITSQLDTSSAEYWSPTGNSALPSQVSGDVTLTSTITGLQTSSSCQRNACDETFVSQAPESVSSNFLSLGSITEEQAIITHTSVENNEAPSMIAGKPFLLPPEILVTPPLRDSSSINHHPRNFGQSHSEDTLNLPDDTSHFQFDLTEFPVCSETLQSNLDTNEASTLTPPHVKMCHRETSQIAAELQSYKQKCLTLPPDDNLTLPFYNTLSAAGDNIESQQEIHQENVFENIREICKHQEMPRSPEVLLSFEDIPQTSSTAYHVVPEHREYEYKSDKSSEVITENMDRGNNDNDHTDFDGTVTVVYACSPSNPSEKKQQLQTTDTMETVISDIANEEHEVNVTSVTEIQDRQDTYTGVSSEELSHEHHSSDQSRQMSTSVNFEDGQVCEVPTAPSAHLCDDEQLTEVSFYSDLQDNTMATKKKEMKQTFQWESVYQSSFNKSLSNDSAIAGSSGVETLSSLPQLVPCQRPIRVGLSKKQKVKHLHKKC